MKSALLIGLIGLTQASGSTCSPRWSQWVAARVLPYGLAMASFAGTGRGLCTTRGRNAGEALLAVPAAEVILAESAAAGHPLIADAISHAFQSGRALTDEQVLSLFLTFERNSLASQERSSMSDYIEGLMEGVPAGPLTMPAHEHSLLPDTYAAVARCAVRYADDQFAGCMRALEGAGARDPPLTRSTFMWAFSHVRARSVQVDDAIDAAALPRSAAICNGGGDRRRALFPAIDLINHRSGAASVLVYRKSAREWAVQSNDTYSADEQIWLDYGGGRDNLKMLMQYGFCEGMSNPTQSIFFGIEELVGGFAAALPNIFTPPIVAMLVHQLSTSAEVAAEQPGMEAPSGGAPDAAAATANAEEEEEAGAVASADMPLFGFDASNVRAHESLESALDMLDGLSVSLGAAADDARKLSVLEQMLRHRQEELECKLPQLEISYNDGLAVEEGAASLRAGIRALLQAEAANVQTALGRLHDVQAMPS